MQRYQNAAQDALGNAIQGMAVSVFNHGTLTLATIYSDNGVTTIPNPTSTDALGMFAFYAADGHYDLQLSKAGLPTTNIPDVLFEDLTVPSSVPATSVGLAVAGPVAVAINLQNYVEDGAYNAMGFVLQNQKAAIRAGTNTADLSTALQTMVSAAGGSKCRIPQGTWIVANQVDYSTTGAYVPGLYIVGDGMGRTIIDNRVANGSAFRSRSSQSGNFQLGGGIHDMMFTTTTSPANSNGAEMQAAYNFVVENCWFKGMTGDGYRITCNLGDNDAAIHPVVRNNRFENLNNGLNCNFANTVTQVSFLQAYGNLFVSCVTAGARYIGANGAFIGNGFATCAGPGLWMVYNNANNPQFTGIANTFENNGGTGVPQLRIDSALASKFLDTEIATTVTIGTACTLGINCGSGSGDASGVVFDGTYVRVGAAFNPYTAFTLGAKTVFNQIQNTVWNTFDAAGQVRYANSGVSNRLSDSSSRIVQGNGAAGSNITLANGNNNNIALAADGTVFLISGPSGAFTLTGLVAPLDNREIILANGTGQVLSLTSEDANSTAANRLRMDNGTTVTVNTSGAVRLAYINGRWQVLGKG